MPNFNKVLLVGNLTRDPELRYTPKGTAVCLSGVAINRKWREESGEDREEVTFVDWTAFGRTAEVINQYCKKGDPILLEGRLQLDQWDDKQTGQKRSKLKVLIESFQFLKSGNGSDERRSEPRPQRAPPPQQEQSQPQQAEDDVPF